ncbi:MAG TPA: prolyl aminopeptidase [Rhodospirillales bacterium]|jgi:proline iminopeptidase|nr:prolyl aminopeptidase [Rhodospirillales bacterium]
MDAGDEKIDLYPPIKPFEQGYLELDGGHRMYWEQSGDEHGLPVLFLHGGPGVGARPVHRRFFDPRHYRVIIFDQRGAGRSKPYAELAGNTTRHLLDDMESLRRHLDVDRWLIFGGSWGATLALAYGVEQAGRCLGFVLRGVFLGRQREIDWFMTGMGAVFPEAWRAFSEFLPAGERNNLLASYHRRLNDADPGVHLPAAAWSAYENAASALLPKPPAGTANGGPGAALSLARLEAHYFKHGMFLDDDYLLANLGKFRHLPAVIVQGRYDMICPVISADELARGWPRAEYVIVPDAGHSAMEPGIRRALVWATEKFKSLV